MGTRAFFDEYIGIVSEVSTGDSFTCLVDLGLKSNITAEVRLLGVSAEPPLFFSGKVALEMLRRLIEGGVVLLIIPAGQVFPNFECTVFAQSSFLGKSVNQYMIENGVVVVV